MATRRFAWVLNLDADLELGAPRGFTPRKSVRAAMTSFVPVLARSLLGAGDLLVDEATPAGAARGFVGRAFCPTPRALETLRRAGAVPEASPPLDVLRRVNGRAFCSALGPTLPGGAFVVDAEAARVKIAEASPLGDRWRVKRAYGMAGRGQRRVLAGAVTGDDLAFLQAGIAEGGVQIEPDVVIRREVAIHGVIATDGSYQRGSLVEQHCDARGAWLATEPLRSLEPPLEQLAYELLPEADRVARSLADAGYFGPFGVDGYLYRGPHGTCVQPRSEINARYSMGFAVGLGQNRS